MTIEVGQVVSVLLQGSTGWWYGIGPAEKGYFPADYVHIFDPAETDAETLLEALRAAAGWNERRRGGLAVFSWSQGWLVAQALMLLLVCCWFVVGFFFWGGGSHHVCRSACAAWGTGTMVNGSTIDGGVVTCFWSCLIDGHGEP